jgi:hypothetical protein
MLHRQLSGDGDPIVVNCAIRHDKLRHIDCVQGLVGGIPGLWTYCIFRVYSHVQVRNHVYILVHVNLFECL